MDNTRFDDLARLFAKSHSRRDALRFLTAGALGALGATLSPRLARPAAADGLCAERVDRPDHETETNGCGPGAFLGSIVPQKYRNADFRPACNKHDACYGTCNSDRTACDRAFLRDLYKQCAKAYPGDHNRDRLKDCKGKAQRYYEAVFRNGQGPYETAQQESCLCCGEGETSCGNKSCCGSNESCCDGLCCAPCEECAGGVCRPKACGDCQTCDVTTGSCAPVDCGPCRECRNVSCQPKECGACQECDPLSGSCRPVTCPRCQTCDRDTGQCRNPDPATCETCVNGQVQPGVPCGSHCCGAGAECCGGGCCAPGKCDSINGQTCCHKVIDNRPYCLRM